MMHIPWTRGAGEVGVWVGGVLRMCGELLGAAAGGGAAAGARLH
jgi:hypothetical protein